MSLTLYFHPLSSFCQKVMMAFYEKEVAFEPYIVMLFDPEEAEKFREISFTGKIPTLRDAERALTIVESSSIIEYIDRLDGRKRLIPAQPDGEMHTRMWDRILDNYVDVPMQRFVGDSFRPEGKKDPFGVEEAAERIQASYRLIDREIGDKSWLAGDELTMADCAAAPALFYANTIIPFPSEQHRLRAYFARLMARPSYVRVLKEAEPYFSLFPLADKPRMPEIPA
jgi:glutathione S-transferase